MPHQVHPKPETPPHQPKLMHLQYHVLLLQHHHRCKLMLLKIDDIQYTF